MLPLSGGADRSRPTSLPRYAGASQTVVLLPSLRKAAERADICLETSFRWRHRFLQAAKDKRASLVTGIVEADETFILKSAKGSHTIVGRAPRKRGGKAKKPGLSTDDHDCILIVRDRHDATTDHILPELEGRTFAHFLKPIVAKDAVLVCDGLPTGPSRAITASATLALSRESANTRGVASRYLESYLGWRRMIERDGTAHTPRHVIIGALG